MDILIFCVDSIWAITNGFFYTFSAEKESWHVDANIGIDLIRELSILGKGAVVT